MVKERRGRGSRKRLHLQRRSSAPKPPAVQREREPDTEKKRKKLQQLHGSQRESERAQSKSEMGEKSKGCNQRPPATSPVRTRTNRIQL
ncbi:hypothetical protein CgunFtcFv8_012700 [Champsocephalus gunnari]|uniref:Uncharacterized protein n=1 Tax=Champsocephalus gunnari TaxID=52237 RepID=A0AAN8DXZ4_CHAGU|nr:hypothetical protein CgunFtcFv8_012700 [Champsocephalus gunnari]